MQNDNAQFFMSIARMFLTRRQSVYSNSFHSESLKYDDFENFF